MRKTRKESTFLFVSVLLLTVLLIAPVYTQQPKELPQVPSHSNLTGMRFLVLHIILSIGTLSWMDGQ